MLRKLVIDLATKYTSGVDKREYDLMMTHVNGIKNKMKQGVLPTVELSGAHPGNLFLVIFAADPNTYTIEITVEAVDSESMYTKRNSQRVRTEHFIRMLHTIWTAAVVDHMDIDTKEILTDSLLARPDGAFTIVMNMSPYYPYEQWSTFPMFTLYAHHSDDKGTGNILFPGTAFFGEKHSPVKLPDNKNDDAPPVDTMNKSTCYGYVHSDRCDIDCDVSVLGAQLRLILVNRSDKIQVDNLEGVQHDQTTDVDGVWRAIKRSAPSAFICTGDSSGYDMWLPFILASGKYAVIIRDEIKYAGHPSERPYCLFRAILDGLLKERNVTAKIQFVDNVISKAKKGLKSKRMQGSEMAIKNHNLLAGIIGTPPPIPRDDPTVTDSQRNMDVSAFATCLLQDSTYMWDYMGHCLCQLVKRVGVTEPIASDSMTILTSMGILRVED
jgi:hypothetical protein